MNYNKSSRTISNISNNNNKYKLVKTNTIQPLIDQNLVNASTKVTSFSSSFYNKSTPTSSFKVDNSTSLILNKTLESSSKLDDLLKRCREIGSSQTQIKNDPITPTSSIAHILAPRVKSTPSLELAKFESKYKLSNSNSTSALTTPHQLTNKIATNKFKLNNKIQFNPQSNKHMVPVLLKSNFKLNRLKTKNKISIKSPKSANVKLDINVLLGRTINNLSRNKFKFINKNRISTTPPVQKIARLNQNILNIKGISFKLNKNGKNLCRISASSSTKFIVNRQNSKAYPSIFKYRKNSSSVSSPLNVGTSKSMTINKYKIINNKGNNSLNFPSHLYRVVLASNLINRSKTTIINRKQIKTTSTNSTKSQTKLNNNKEKKYCLFFNRFGRCVRGEACPYAHDPNRVSLCPRGTCQVENCPYSHKTSAEKMPICSYYANGCCNRENCPYSHVKFNQNAEFCTEFAKGYCPLGFKCDKAHLNECPDFEVAQKCPRGSKCPLLHRKKKIYEKNSKVYQNEIKNKKEEKIKDAEEEQSFIQFKLGTSLSQIETNEDSKSIGTFEEIKKNDLIDSPLKTRPSFFK